MDNITPTFATDRAPRVPRIVIVARRAANSDSLRLMVMAPVLEWPRSDRRRGDVKVYIKACNLKCLCYNADTSRNKLSPKGLPVNQTFRLFRTVRLICLLAAVASFAFPAESLAASGTSSSASTAKKRLTLKSTQQKAASTARSRRTAAVRAKAAQQVRQARDVAQPRFKLDESGALVPDVRAEAAIIYNPQNGQVCVLMLSRDLEAERELVLDWRDASPTRVLACETLTGPDLKAVNTFEKPNVVAPKKLDAPPVGPRMTFKLPPRSYSIAHFATS